MDAVYTANKFEWIDAENTFLIDVCQIDNFPWGQRFFWDKGPDHGKYNFIRLLNDGTDEKEFDGIIEEQKAFFRERSKSLHIKIPSSVFLTLPRFLDRFKLTGSPLVSILIQQKLLPSLEEKTSILIRECKTSDDLELFIQFNASGRDWPLDHHVYNILRQSFLPEGVDRAYYLLCIDGKPACTALVIYFGEKFNLQLLATHKDFQRRGLMNYMNLWLAQELKKDFYVQVNDNEPSYLYYSSLPGATIANTEVKYVDGE